jgi:DNA-binding transcriptional regulator YhcF (GntR family)
MIVRVAASSPVPPFEQLRTQIAAAIASGGLPEGHQLPPIRQLAKDLDLAPGTVARAYRELEAAGLVVSGGRRGTRVAPLPPGAAPPTDQRLAAAANTFAAAARDLGVGVGDALVAVHTALAGGTDAGIGSAPPDARSLTEAPLDTPTVRTNPPIAAQADNST